MRKIRSSRLRGSTLDVSPYVFRVMLPLTVGSTIRLSFSRCASESITAVSEAFSRFICPIGAGFGAAGACGAESPAERQQADGGTCPPANAARPNNAAMIF